MGRGRLKFTEVCRDLKVKVPTLAAKNAARMGHALLSPPSGCGKPDTNREFFRSLLGGGYAPNQVFLFLLTFGAYGEGV